MIYEDARRRYDNDAEYRLVVDALFDAMVRMRLTPGELRDAAMLASIRFEEHKSRHLAQQLRSIPPLNSITP